MNMTVLFKKYTYGLLSIATTLIGCFCNFTNATNYTCSDSSFTITEDSYFIVNYEVGRLGFFEVFNTISNEHYCYTNTNGFNIDNSCTTINSFPLILSAGTWQIDCSNITTSSFSVVPAITSCPTCPTCPGINGQCSVSDKINENIIYEGTTNLSNSSYTTIFNYGNNGAGTYCIKLTSSNAQTIDFGFTNTNNGTPTNLYKLYNDQYGNRVCLYGNKNYFTAKLNAGTNTINYEVYKLTDLLADDIPCTQQNCQTCEEQYTSSECQEEYELIPIEDIDQTYCINNNLCPIIEGTGDVQWSALYINNIQHLGNDIINIDIPEEIERDYNYGSGETNIDVIGYGYDQEKMQNMVNTQFTPPTSEDLENVIGKIADFLPLLAIMLLIVYAWRLIKKVF